MNDKLIISPVITTTTSSKDCPTKVFRIRLLESDPSYSNLLSIAGGRQTITLRNAHPFSIEASERKQIFLNTFVMTSLPGICIIYGNEHLQLFGLNYIVNQTKTNDQPLSITVCNITDKKLTFKENSIDFYCLILVAKSA